MQYFEAAEQFQKDIRFKILNRMPLEMDRWPVTTSFELYTQHKTISHHPNFVWGKSEQWRIQDFPHVGAPTQKNLLFCNYFAKNCMKWKNLDPGGVPGAPLDPPMLNCIRK